ncbi:hypothetical protein BKA70DRAFT_1569390 [Coprinopsis sp. MPI-PUGE-AT-0042]|nr:hypothetical protein BKA70DRAFT_1569390 [Coprinopsis sp. MPI-PUGE-AT-0042]
MVKLTPKLIQDAKAGNPKKIWELASAVEESGSYNAAALDACLTHLEADSLHKPLCGIGDTGIFALRWASITCLWRMLRACGGSPKINQALRTTTAKRLVDTFEGVIIWMDLVVSIPLRDDCVTPNMLNYMAETLIIMIELDQTLPSYVLYSPRAMNLCLKLWNGIRRKEGCSIVEITLEGGSPIPDLLLSLHKKSPQALYDGILSAPKIIQRGFAKGLLSRLHQLRSWGPTSQYPDVLVCDYADTLTDITFGLVANPAIDAQLKKAQYLEDWVQTVRVLHQVAGARLPRQVGILTYFLLRIACGTGQNPIVNIVELLSNDYFPLLFDVFRNTGEPSEKGKREGGILVFNELMPYIFYPEIHELIVGAVEDLPPQAIKHLLAKNHIKADWSQWMGALEQAGHVFRQLKSSPSQLHRHCDNIQHYNHQRTASVQGQDLPKTCSGCKTTLYCSVECQKEDWKARHRKECDIMRHHYLDRRQRKVRYTKEMRFAHAAVITEALNKTPIEEIIEGRRQKGKADNEVITLGDFTGGVTGAGKLHTTSMPLLGYLAYADTISKGDCEAMNQRAKEMSRRFWARKTPPVMVNLTEAMFCWTQGLLIFVMTEHYYDKKNKRWQLARSLVRFRSSEVR